MHARAAILAFGACLALAVTGCGPAGRRRMPRRLPSASTHAHERSPRWARVTGLRRTLYENSLLLVMGAIWLAT